MPPTVPLNHYSGSRNQQNRTRVLFHYSMLMYSSRRACFEHSNFFKVNVANPPHTQLREHEVCARKDGPTSSTPCGGPTDPSRNPTTSFLTATTLIYAIGAGITAAAGTRLALQLILEKGFKFYSFQLQDMDALYCYFLSLPPCVRIG